MRRPITLCSGQFGDIQFETLCGIAGGIGYEGLEAACHSHIDIHRVLDDAQYLDNIQSTLKKNNLNIWALSAHLIGQCVGDNWDPRLDRFVPDKLAGKPEDIRTWAIQEMAVVAQAAKKMGIKLVTCFTGSPIWSMWYSYPPTTSEMIGKGFARIKELWDPIFDIFDDYDVKLAFEIHPGEIAFDYYSALRFMEMFKWRKTLGINFDPSHLLWQGCDPAVFLHDFAKRIYHVHMKDVKMTLNGRTGILGSHIDFGDTRRGWNFVSLGHGNVDFDGIIRELNQIRYTGPLSVEWEDSNMDRIFGIAEAYEYAKKINFEPSDVRFDEALKIE